MKDRRMEVLSIKTVPGIIIIDMTRRHIRFLIWALDQNQLRGSFFPHSNVVLLEIYKVLKIKTNFAYELIHDRHSREQTQIS